jgi:hypothetical protein
MKVLVTAIIWSLLAAVQLNAQVSLGIYGARKIMLHPSGEACLAGFNFTSRQPRALEDVFGAGTLASAPDPSDADGVYLWSDVQQDFVKYFRKSDGNFYKASDPNGSPAPVTLQSGDALFLRSSPTSTTTNSFYITGNVSMADQAATVYAETIVFANPYPSHLNLNSPDVDWSAATAGELPTLADQVHIWNPQKAGGPGFDNYFLKSVAGSNVWHSGVSPFTAADPVVPSGGGAVYTAINSFTNQIVRPFEI